MKKPSSRTLLITALVATLAAALLAPRDDDGVSAPAAQKRGKAPSSVAAASRAGTKPSDTAPVTAQAGALQGAPRESLGEAVTDLFAASSWYVPPPPPPPVPPPPPPPPSAPPLPFGYIGQYIEGNTRLIMLTQGDRLLNVASGDVIDRIYKIGSVKGGQLAITYLPLNIEQTLNTGVSP